MLEIPLALAASRVLASAGVSNGQLGAPTAQFWIFFGPLAVEFPIRTLELHVIQ